MSHVTSGLGMTGQRCATAQSTRDRKSGMNCQLLMPCGLPGGMQVGKVHYHFFTFENDNW